MIAVPIIGGLVNVSVLMCLNQSLFVNLHCPCVHHPGSLPRGCCECGASDHDYDRHSTLSNVEELGLEIGESEGGNDEIREDTQTADDQSRGKLKHNIAPDNGIRGCFNGLIPFVRLVLDTGLVGTNTLNHEPLLVFVEALCFHWRIGQPPADEQAPDTGE